MINLNDIDSFLGYINLSQKFFRLTTIQIISEVPQELANLDKVQNLRKIVLHKVNLDKNGLARLTRAIGTPSETSIELRECIIGSNIGEIGFKELSVLMCSGEHKALAAFYKTNKNKIKALHSQTFPSETFEKLSELKLSCKYKTGI